MRAVVQRVSSARVTVDGELVGEIGPGLLVFLGVSPTDTSATAQRIAQKIVALRVFEDENGRMNRSLADVGGAILCVSQFTLYGDVRRGNRPSFTAAAEPAHARALYIHACEAIERAGVICARGRFGAHMKVEAVNDGPVTLILDTDDLDRPRRESSC